jgi:hypothetical protein
VCVCVCVCVCVYPYLPSMQFTCALLYCHLWSVCLYHIFPQYLTNGKIFGKKFLKIKCVFLFSLKLLSKTSLIVRRVQPDIKNAHVTYSSILKYFHGTCIFWSDFLKSTQILYFMNIRVVGGELFYMDGRAWRSLSLHANAANKSSRCTSQHAARKNGSCERKTNSGRESVERLCLRSAKRKDKVEYEMKE